MRSTERPSVSLRPGKAGTRTHRRVVCAVAMAALALAGCAPSPAQTGARPTPAPANPGVTVLLVSDLHFDPFAAGTDIVRRLRVTPTAAWAGLLGASSDTALATYGSDSNFPLLRSAGAAIQAAVPNPAFVVVTGDFLRHDFKATYKGIFGDTASAGAAAFADSTMAFMAHWISSLVPSDVPVYPSIGNNDSGCGD